ncbi:DUF418 domain-containing protein [Streptomyces sp. NPDC001508]|uniref:DUF418 domain-containing protein n=1 Tax=Streptomyces sp. NPDC001508 TaxID=3154656 RepID=UPI003331E4C4
MTSGGQCGRVRELDVLRGFAASGVLLVDAQLPAGPCTGFGDGPDAVVRPAAARVPAAAGRMALTHCLSQSLVLAFVFTGYGLGL